ncbi:hypothetical protein Tco_0917277 [Tanacetum coccineum]
MTTLVEYMIIAGAENRPLMLEKSLYDSWKIRMEFYMENRENGRMILDSVLNGPLIWEKVKLLMQGTKLSLQEKECKLHDEFDKFSFVKRETLYQYYWRFAHLINNMNVIQYVNETSSSKYKVSEQSSTKMENAAWFKEKAMLAEALEARKNLDEEQLAFLAYPGTPNGQVVKTTIQNNAAFQTKDLDAYDSDCDDVSNAKAVLMANLSNYGSDVISEVPHSEIYHNDMDNQSVHAMQDFEQTPVVDFSNNEIYSNNNIILYSQYLQKIQQTVVQDTNFSLEKMIDSQMDHMIKEKIALKQQIDSLEQNLFNQIKEKESLLQTFTVSKNESKEKETKYMENEID